MTVRTATTSTPRRASGPMAFAAPSPSSSTARSADSRSVPAGPGSADELGGGEPGVEDGAVGGEGGEAGGDGAGGASERSVLAGESDWVKPNRRCAAGASTGPVPAVPRARPVVRCPGGARPRMVAPQPDRSPRPATGAARRTVGRSRPGRPGRSGRRLSQPAPDQPRQHLARVLLVVHGVREQHLQADPVHQRDQRPRGDGVGAAGERLGDALAPTRRRRAAARGGAGRRDTARTPAPRRCGRRRATRRGAAASSSARSARGVLEGAAARRPPSRSPRWPGAARRPAVRRGS